MKAVIEKGMKVLGENGQVWYTKEFNQIIERFSRWPIGDLLQWAHQEN
jgi:hypothetical protein